MNTIAVVDYGMGNLRSVAQAVIHAASVVDQAEVIVTSNPQVVRDAHRVVLPGQGAMPDCMSELKASGLLEAVLDAASKKPLFGVCVGMQMLLDHSAEGDTSGLGLIAGGVIKFDLAGRTQAWVLPAKSNLMTPPAIKPNPEVSPSALWSSNICMPTQTPNRGFLDAASNTASSNPEALSSDMQSGIAPCPGNTTRWASRTTCGLEVTITSAWSTTDAAWITACATERKLPMP